MKRKNYCSKKIKSGPVSIRSGPVSSLVMSTTTAKSQQHLRRTMCHRRQGNSDILSKVALLLVLLPHMAQTQYHARGKSRNSSSFFLVHVVYIPSCYSSLVAVTSTYYHRNIHTPPYIATESFFLEITF